MWRKNDFDRLIAHLKTMNAGIVIEECL